MKHMKITLLLLFVGTIQLFAQGPRGGHGENRGERLIQKLDSVVNLTDDQKGKITIIQTEYQSKFRAMREKEEQPDREAMMRLRDEQHQKINAVLTPAQLALWTEAQDERKQEMKKMHSEIKTYREQNIVPTMKRLHTEFEGNLSVEEKATIATVKQQMRDMKKTFYVKNKDTTVHGPGFGEHRCEEGNCKKGHGKDMDKAQRDEVHQFAQSSLQPILDAHKTELDKVISDLTPLQATWKADMKSIHQKYATKEKSCKPDKMHGDSGKLHAKDKGQNQDWSKIKFILNHEEG